MSWPQPSGEVFQRRIPKQAAPPPWLRKQQGRGSGHLEAWPPSHTHSNATGPGGLWFQLVLMRSEAANATIIPGFSSSHGDI